MAKKIETLTDEQSAMLSIYREESREKALRPHFATDKEMRQAVAAIYTSMGRPAPTVFVFVDPFQCLSARSILKGQLWDQLGVQLRGQLRVQLRDQLGGQLWVQLWVQLREAHDTLWFAGGSELYWVAFYRFAEKIGVKYDAKQSATLDAWERYAEICGPLYPYDGIAFASRRPDVLSFDEQRRLHAETGPAMRFPSGYALYAWHGTRIPAVWIDQPEALTPQIALGQTDTALRVAATQIIGWQRMIDQLDAKVVNRHPEGMAGGELLSVKKSKFNPDDKGEMRFLRAACPRNGTICFRVPDGTKTAHEAQAWSVGLPPDIYKIPSIRT